MSHNQIMSRRISTEKINDVLDSGTHNEQGIIVPDINDGNITKLS
jgi:hypothetical protein